MQFADPRTDFALARIFGNEKAKDVLISFLNAVLSLEHTHPITSVQLLNPYQAPKIQTLKHSFLDVKCVDNRGVEFVVEMQVQYTEGFEKRVQYNACKAFVGQIPTGEDFPRPNQVIGISIVDFVMFKDFGHYLSCHVLDETVSNHCYLDEIRHFFIELLKFTVAEAELETTTEKWCFFIKHAGRLEMIPEKLDMEPFRKAFALANRANMTKEEWEAYDATAVWIQDQRGTATAAHKQGKEERTLELAQRMWREGIDLNVIARVTELSPEVIRKLTM